LSENAALMSEIFWTVAVDPHLTFMGRLMLNMIKSACAVHAARPGYIDRTARQLYS